MIFVRRAEEIAMCAIICRVTYDFIELREEVDRILRHLDVDGRRELRAHATHALARRALALMRLALDHEHVCATRLSEVISDTRADNAAADDDDIRGFSHDALIFGTVSSTRKFKKLSDWNGLRNHAQKTIPWTYGLPAA